MKEIKLITKTNQVHFVKIPKEAVNIVYKDLSIEFRTPLLNGLAFLNHSIHLGFEVKEIIKVAETSDAYCPNCEAYIVNERVTYEECCDNCGTEIEWHE